MLDISFSVRVETLPGQHIRVVGSLRELGEWAPERGLGLSLRRGAWQGVVREAKSGSKFEFKVVKVSAVGEVEWEQLPNNSNRKFKPKCPSQLHLEWSRPEGRITPLSRSSYKLRGLPAAMINRPERKKEEEFDPYRTAREEDSGEDEEEFLLVRRKMSDEIAISSGDLEEIYYNSSAVEIFCGLLKKVKVYVVGEEPDLTVPFYAHLEDSLKRLPQHYLARWIAPDCLSNRTMNSLQLKLKKRDSLFEVGAEELQLEALYSRTSYFLLLQVETALQLQENLCRVPTCLYLPADEYKEVIAVLPQLNHVQLICFDQAAANKSFYEYLRSRESESGGEESEGSTILSLTAPSVEDVVRQLHRLRYRETVTVNTLDSISEADGLSLLAEPNTVNIIDAAIVDLHSSFADTIVSQLHNHSLLIIVASGTISENVLQFRDCRNVALIYGGFERIILEGKEYHPLRKFQQTLELFRMKSKLYKQSMGGDLVERQSSIIYTLPEGRQDYALKVEAECRNVVKGFGFVKVSRKGTRVKVSWNLAKEVRLLRTLCEIKYINFGQLGNFCLVAQAMSLKQLKEDIRLLIEHKNKLFVNKGETRVSYYSYGKNQPASCTIIPN